MNMASSNKWTKPHYNALDYHVSPPNFDKIPQALKDRPQWCVWRLGFKGDSKPDKKPFMSPTRMAKSNDPSTWLSFEEARDLYQSARENHSNNPLGQPCFHGVGFFLKRDSNLVGIDADHISQWQQEVDDLCDNFTGTYSEQSPSGDGLRIFALGKLSGKDGKRGPNNWLEVYDGTRGRFLTVTGNQYGDTKDVNRAQQSIDWLEARYPKQTIKRATAPSTCSVVPPEGDDNAVLNRLFAQPNGDAIRALWTGDWQADARYPSQSEADYALLNHLMFGTRGNPAQVLRMFGKSRLFRPEKSRQRSWDVDRLYAEWKERSLSIPRVDEIDVSDEPTTKPKGTQITPNALMGTKNYLRFADVQAEDRPCFRLRTEGKQPGVWLHGIKKEGKGTDSAPVPFDVRICSAFEVTGKVRDVEREDDAGIALRIWDGDAASDHVLNARDIARQSEWLAVLLARGVTVTPGFEQEVKKYLVDGQERAKRIRSSRACGWIDNETYLLPDGPVGGKGEILYRGSSSKALCAPRGGLSEWRDHIGRRCMGNTLATIAVSLALAAPLMMLLGLSVLALHFYGKSRTGKTTAARVAVSVYGPPKSLKSWRATANALEAECAAHNDGLLVLDELSSAESAQDVSEVAYMVGNGQGKARMRPDASLKHTFQWRIAFLSTGEETLDGKLSSMGLKAKTGQLMRILQVPLDLLKQPWGDPHRPYEEVDVLVYAVVCHIISPVIFQGDPGRIGLSFSR